MKPANPKSSISPRKSRLRNGFCVVLRASAAISAAVTVVYGTAALAVNEPSVIPQPQSLTRLEGAFTVAPDLVIATDADSQEAGKFLADRLGKATGYSIKTVVLQKGADQKFPGGVIFLKTEQADLGAEGYELHVTPEAATIRAQTQAGLFYGVQTLLQLLPPEVFSEKAVKDFIWQVPCVDITDIPRFRWRGLMLDVSRNFFSKQELKKILDAMALHKLNVFHWHLTDNEGWRIEIKKYPKLTEEGAWRKEIGRGLDPKASTAYGPDGRYGGFYTQDDIREVVAYAAARHITVVPEIEMPGHSGAALSAYPEFGCSGAPGSNVYSPAKEETFAFLENVLAEVFQLFPGRYIHIGGDEVTPDAWLKDPACQELMKREGLKTPAELQGWFIRRIEKFVSARGKTLIGWTEIANGDLPGNAVLMDWRGGGREAASAGHDVVMSPASACYLDYVQSKDLSAEPFARVGYRSLEAVYALEPIPAGLADDKQKHILGAQCNLWTEYIPNLKHAEYMIFPRLSALAEVVWSPKGARDYEGFVGRVKVNQKRLDGLGANYRDVALGDGTATIGLKIGDWNTGKGNAEAAPAEWNVTKNVTARGKARVNFQLKSRRAALAKISWVALLENGQEISRDEHAGLCRPVARYTLDVPDPKPGAIYTLRAQIAGDRGKDSSCEVFWLREPANQ